MERHDPPGAIAIEFLYFESCPNSVPTLENLRQAIDDLGINVEPRVTEVDPDTFARPFPGSPSVLVDGIDLYSLQVPESFDFSCRTFEIRGARTGVLPADFIRDRLISFMQRTT